MTTFTCEKLDPAKKVNPDAWIGAEWYGDIIQQPMHGDLAALDIYVHEKSGGQGEEEEEEEVGLPDCIKNLIIQDQMVVATVEPPTKKKRGKNQSDCGM